MKRAQSSRLEYLVPLLVAFSAGTGALAVSLHLLDRQQPTVISGAQISTAPTAAITLPTAGSRIRAQTLNESALPISGVTTGVTGDRKLWLIQRVSGRSPVPAVTATAAQLSSKGDWSARIGPFHGLRPGDLIRFELVIASPECDLAIGALPRHPEVPPTCAAPTDITEILVIP